MNTNYKKLIVWQKSIQLVKLIYQLTQNFPKEELYGLTSQMRRSAVSTPSNIAEGHTRKSNNEFIQFLYIAKSSMAELETQIIIAKELGYINNKNSKKTEELILEILKMLSALIQSKKTKV